MIATRTETTRGRRPSPAPTETYLVAYSHSDDLASDPARLYGEPPVGQTLAQAMSDIRDKLAGGYAVEMVVRFDHAAQTGEDATKRVAEAFAASLMDWHDSPEAGALDDFCTGELGYSPLRESWRDADDDPRPGSLNGRSHDGARGGLSALSIWFAAFVLNIGVLIAMGGA